MRMQITLTPSESKRLIAKGVMALPSVKKALKDHTIILSTGTTDAFLVEEMIGVNIEKKSTYTVGVIADGLTGETNEADRIPPYMVTKGRAQPQDVHWKTYLPDMKPGDVFIKGGNAVDHTGLAAVLAANNMAGTVGAAWGPVMQRGVEFIIPIGLEKLVPDVREAVEFLAGAPVDTSLGNPTGLMPVLGATVVTEITALDLLYGLKAKCIAAGGIAGSEGSVVLVADGPESNVKKAMEEMKNIKGEPQVG
ncbi:MAG TPA: hypothetical protein IAC41_08510 [Candidatus Merdenecus merdavium]|nr:hypothetical protein [Candidatus Merdenecus merdavium]